jgi:hypothetical protein
MCCKGYIPAKVTDRKKHASVEALSAFNMMQRLFFEHGRRGSNLKKEVRQL